MSKGTIKYRLLLAGLYPLALMPLGLLYGLSDVISFLLHRVIGYRLKVVRKNLRASFPEKTEKELYKIERDFYRHLCDCFAEIVKMLHISDKEVFKRIKLKNEGLVHELLKGGHPIILYLGHFGNWEWVPAMTLMLDEPKKMGALYQPQHDKVMDDLMIKIRSRFNLICIQKSRAYRYLLEMKRETPSFMIGFIADQRPLGSHHKHWTWFLDQPTAYMAGGETIGERVGAHYLYVEARKVKRGHYVLEFKKMEPDPEDKDEFPYTRKYFRMLEESIRENPPFWLWSHNRWKSKPEEGQTIL